MGTLPLKTNISPTSRHFLSVDDKVFHSPSSNLIGSWIELLRDEMSLRSGQHLQFLKVKKGAEEWGFLRRCFPGVLGEICIFHQAIWFWGQGVYYLIKNTSNTADKSILYAKPGKNPRLPKDQKLLSPSPTIGKLKTSRTQWWVKHQQSPWFQNLGVLDPFEEVGVDTSFHLSASKVAGLICNSSQKRVDIDSYHLNLLDRSLCKPSCLMSWIFS